MTRPIAIALALIVAVGCGSSGSRAREADVGYREKGIASWYGPGFHGKRTANGEVYDMNGLTAAHRFLPFDVTVEVRNLDNGERVRVRVNDRGPFVRGRIIDLSREAAKRIGMLGPGTARVAIEVVRRPRPGDRLGDFWVQVGAFRDWRYADDLRDALARRFPSVEIRSEDGWFRVGFGPYRKRGDADDLLRKLERQGHNGIIVNQ